MYYDNVTAVKVLQLLGHFAYLVKSIFDFNPGTTFELIIPLNCKIVKQLNDFHALQDIFDISDIDFHNNYLSVETNKNKSFAKIKFIDGFTIEELVGMYPKLKLPPCPVCNKEGYHIPGSKVCYTKDFKIESNCGCN